MSRERPQISEILCDIVDSAQRDNRAWFPVQAQSPFFMAACMAGEVGEVLNLLKKIERGTHSWTPEMREAVEEEIADVFTYLASLVSVLDMDLAKAYWEKRQKNALRFAARKALEAPEPGPRIFYMNSSQPPLPVGDDPTIQMPPVNADGYPA